MPGRRTHQRYGATHVNGTLKVLRDVTLRSIGEDGFVAFTDASATAGEFLTLERVVDGMSVSAQVCVIDSRPVIVGGSVRHCLQLQVVAEMAEDTTTPTRIS